MRKRVTMRVVVFGVVGVSNLASTGTASAGFVNRFMISTPTDFEFRAVWIDTPANPRGAGLSVASMHWQFGFDDAAPNFSIADLILGDGAGGAHKVGPHGEPVPNTFQGVLYVNYDPGDPARQLVRIVDHGDEHIDRFEFTFTPIAGGFVPPGGGPAVPATMIEVDFRHTTPTPGTVLPLAMAGLVAVRRRRASCGSGHYADP